MCLFSLVALFNSMFVKGTKGQFRHWEIWVHAMELTIVVVALGEIYAWRRLIHKKALLLRGNDHETGES